MRIPLAYCLVLACSVFSASAQAQSGYQYQGNDAGQLVRCESIDGRTRECAIDARGGVGLVRQLSKAACIEGRSWGYGRDHIWVSQGCRAEFTASPRHDNRPDDRYGGGVFRCESNDGRVRQCAIDTRGGVELVRQLSRARCVRGESWGWNERGVWVSRGCRAEFRVRSGWHGGRPDGNAQVVRCESNDGRPRLCPVTTRGGVRLVRQLSRTPCIEGRTWGRDRAGIWVSNGCRAEFEVGYRRDQGWGWGRD